MKPICIYHGNCADGFGAAWVFHKYSNTEFDFHAGRYQETPPNCEDRDVYLVDFSYKRTIVANILNVAKSVTLIDHHKTALEDLDTLIASGYLQSLCSLKHSGAVLAWMWFNGTDLSNMPKLLAHIEDRDLWTFALTGTREIQANVFSHPYDFAVWDILMSIDPTLLITEGAAIERKHHKDVEELIQVTQREMYIGGEKIPVANLPYTLSSDAGHYMAIRHSAKMAACYWDTPEGRVFSLRSTETGPDVSVIAMQYGGGGHTHASGFKVPYTHALAKG